MARETSAPQPGPPFVVEALPSSAASDLHVVKMTGEADLVATEPLMRTLLEAAGSTVVADVSGLTFIDASAIGAFVCAKQKIESSGHHLTIRGAHGFVRRVFDLLELSGMLEDG